MYYKYIYKIKNKPYGVGLNTINWFFKRAEINYILEDNLSSTQRIIASNFFDQFLFTNMSYKTRCLLNIYLLHLLGTYRGWRHSRGLPVRGQRTWSNSWSTYRSNLTLRTYKITISKKIYGTSFSNESFTAYLAEEVNNMWRAQWGSEWFEARRKRINTQKNARNAVKIDLVAMSKLQIDSYSKNKDVNKLKKQKRNVFTLGFDSGFTKQVLKNSLDKSK